MKIKKLMCRFEAGISQGNRKGERADDENMAAGDAGVERGKNMKYYPICDECIEGKGKECHTAGCVYCFNDVPAKTVFTDLGIDGKERKLDREKVLALLCELEKCPHSCTEKCYSIVRSRADALCDAGDAIWMSDKGEKTDCHIRGG